MVETIQLVAHWEGRKEGREDERKEGRKGGREEGRKGGRMDGRNNFFKDK